jgi:branched-subunit amino acid transport protein
MIFAAIVALAVGTYALRLSGVLLAHRVSLPGSVRQVLPVAAATLLSALAGTAALTQGGHLVGGVARPAGVLVGLLLAWRRAPFVVVVVAAAATAALLRLAGID